MNVYVTIGGVRVRCEAEHALVGTWLREVLDYFGLDDAGAVPGLPEVTLVLRADPARSPELAEVTRYGALRVGRDGARYVAWGTGTVLTADPVEGWAEGTVALSTPHAVLTREVLAEVVFGLMLLLRPHGLLPLHAAALAHPRGGVLMAAPSDAGKSTATYQLVRQGWGFVSDDAVLLRATGMGVTARVLRRPFGLDADARERFPELAAHWRPQFAEVTKGSVRIDRLRPAQAVPLCTPRLVLIPTLSGAPESRLEPVAKAEALWALLAQSALATLDPVWAAEHLDVLRRLLDQAPAYRLLAGRDVLDAPARFARLLEDALPADATLLTSAA
jgi:hypothetical protein